MRSGLRRAIRVNKRRAPTFGHVSSKLGNQLDNQTGFVLFSCLLESGIQFKNCHVKKHRIPKLVQFNFLIHFDICWGAIKPGHFLTQLRSAFLATVCTTGCACLVRTHVLPFGTCFGSPGIRQTSRRPFEAHVVH